MSLDVCMSDSEENLEHSITRGMLQCFLLTLHNYLGINNINIYGNTRNGSLLIVNVKLKVKTCLIITCLENAYLNIQWGINNMST